VKLTPEQDAFVEAIRDFAARERFERPEDGHSDEVAARMGELGWYGLQIPERYGGSGGSFLDATLFLEETARGRIPVNAYGVTLIVVGALNRFGTEEQKAKWLQPLLDGEIVSCYSMTEPHGGADPTHFRTQAVRDGDEWVINGEKWFSSNARYASFLIAMVVTDPDVSAYQGMSMFIVPSDAEGLNIVRNVAVGESDEHGTHAYIRYENVRVPADHLLGGEGQGFLKTPQGASGFGAEVLAPPLAGESTARVRVVVWDRWLGRVRPENVYVDAEATVPRGGSVGVVIEAPAAMRAVLWTRGAGEAWRPQAVVLDSLGQARVTLGRVL